MPFSLGSDIAKTIFLAVEEHKLTQEFTVSNATVYKGQPVYLYTDGTIRAYTSTVALTEPILGYSLHKAAANANATIVCQGYAIIYVYVLGSTGGGLTGTLSRTTTGMAKYDSFYSSGTTEYNFVVTATKAGTLTVSGAATTVILTAPHEGLVLDVPALATPVRYLVVA